MKLFQVTSSVFQLYHFQRPPSLCTRSMPQSKKDLRTAKQKQNVAKGIGDKDGKIPSNIKVTNEYSGGSTYD